jgi:hypothetical protein
MVSPVRSVLSAVLLATLLPSSASASFFWKAPDLRGAPVTGAEPGVITGPLAGATPAELRAALLWNLRSGLNVAALQCQFDETLLTRRQYNVLLDNHRTELAGAYQVLSNYFKRTDKKGGQTNLDRYGTRTYSGFSTVQGQLTFCQTASSVGREAIWAKKGELYRVAENRMRELRNSLVLGGEQQFVRYFPVVTAHFVSLDSRCWRKDKLRPECAVA